LRSPNSEHLVHAHGALWDVYAHVDKLKSLRADGCFWDLYTGFRPAEGDLRMLRWPSTKGATGTASRTIHRTTTTRTRATKYMIQWLAENRPKSASPMCEDCLGSDFDVEEAAAIVA